jgi:Ca2+/Na+ antiporter
VESVVALAGGILLILALGGGIQLDSRLVRLHSPVPQGDRAAAVLLGAVLVALAAILEADLSRVALWIDMGLGAAIAVGYAMFIWRSR